VIARGAIFSASEKGVLTGKPRPVLIVQNNRTVDIHSTITVCLISTVLSGQSLFRIAIVPSEENGLDAPSEVQADHIFSFRRENLDRPIGTLSAADMSRVDAALRLWLDL
jgi:mRNA interferase MazF